MMFIIRRKILCAVFAMTPLFGVYAHGNPTVEEEVARLAAGLTSSKPDVPMLSAQELSRFPYIEVENYLIAFINMKIAFHSRDTDAVSIAAISLERIGTQRIVPNLRALLKDAERVFGWSRYPQLKQDFERAIAAASKRVEELPSLGSIPRHRAIPQAVQQNKLMQGGQGAELPKANPRETELQKLSKAVPLLRPLKELLTYEEWEALVLLKVSEIPELRAVWYFRTQKKVSVDFEGGRLRGLLKWLHIQLQDHSLAEVEQMLPPSIEGLPLQGNSDKDLVAYEQNLGRLFDDHPQYYEDWDILEPAFFDASIAAGGTTLEKILVNPDEITDPTQGLRHYYEGRLVFLWAESPQDITNAHLEDNSRTALALRYARFMVEFPELVPDEQSVELIRSIPKNELPGIDGENYWLTKALRKLYVSTNFDTNTFFTVLNYLGLFEHVSKLGIRIGESEHKQFKLVADKLVGDRKHWQQMIESGVSMKEIRVLLAMMARTPQQWVEVLMSLLPMVTSADDFVMATDLPLHNNKERAALSIAIQRNIDRLIRMPDVSVSHIKKMIDKYLFTGTIMQLIDAALTNGIAKSAQDYVDLLSQDWAKEWGLLWGNDWRQSWARPHMLDDFYDFENKAATKAVEFARMPDADVTKVLTIVQHFHNPRNIRAFKEAFLQYGRFHTFRELIQLMARTGRYSLDSEEAGRLIIQYVSPSLLKQATPAEVEELIQSSEMDRGAKDELRKRYRAASGDFQEGCDVHLKPK